MAHDMTKTHTGNCQCVKCRPLERPCDCDGCREYVKNKKQVIIFDERYEISPPLSLKKLEPIVGSYIFTIYDADECFANSYILIVHKSRLETDEEQKTRVDKEKRYLAEEQKTRVDKEKRYLAEYKNATQNKRANNENTTANHRR